MKTVRVTMSDVAFQQLSTEAINKGFPGIASLLLEKSGVLTDDAEAADIKKRAFAKAGKLVPGAKFKLRGLFEKEDWECFSKGARIRAGRQFYSDVEAGVQGISILEKSSSNHQYYVRTNS